MNKLKCSTILIILLLVWLGTAAQPSEAQQRGINDVVVNYTEAVDDGQGTVTVSAYVSVVDDTGQPIEGLDANDFTLQEDGRAVSTPMSVSIAQDPITIILVFDTSGSMANVNNDNILVIDAAKNAAIGFIETLEEGDQVAVYTFSNNVDRIQPITIDHNMAINNIIEQVTYVEFGETCLYDALREAIITSANVPSGRRAIISLTDGADTTANGSCQGTTLDEVVNNATEAKVPIFPIGFGQVNVNELEDLARRTGGRASIEQDSTQLVEQFNTITDQLGNQYLLQYETYAPSGSFDLTVSITDGTLVASGQRGVFIPERSIPPTSTPPPPFDITINASQTADGLLIEVIDMPPAAEVESAELFVNDRPFRQTRQAPFTFTITEAELGNGTHTLRVEVTNIYDIVAIRELEVTINLPTPTPAPVASIGSASSEASTQPEELGILDSNFSLVLLIVGVAGFLLLLGGGLLVYGFWGRGSTSPPETYPDYQQFQQPDLEPVPGMVTNDIIDDGFDPDRTMDDLPVVAHPDLDARLVVIENKESLSQEIYILDQAKMTIGRNAGGVVNTIDIQDKGVSRRHAEIAFNGYGFIIRDVGSSYGTKINGQQIDKYRDTDLDNGMEIAVGPRVKFRLDITTDIDLSTRDDTADDPDQKTTDFDEDATDLFNIPQQQ